MAWLHHDGGSRCDVSAKLFWRWANAFSELEMCMLSMDYFFPIADLLQRCRCRSRRTHGEHSHLLCQQSLARCTQRSLKIWIISDRRLLQRRSSLLLFKCWHHLYFFIKPGETLTFKKRKQHGITMPPVEDDSGSSSSGEEETGSESEVSSAPSPTSFFSFSTLFFWMWMGKNINIDSQLHCAMFWTSVRFFLVHVGVQSTIVKEIRRNPWSRPFNCPRRCKWEEPSLKLTKRKMHL